MWLSAFLIATSIISCCGDFCVPAYLPLDCDIKTTGVGKTNKTWSALDAECGRMYPGYRILQKRFINLTQAEKRLCQGAEFVPLGARKSGENLMWINGHNVSEEVVSDNYTNTLKLDTTTHGLVAALNPQSKQWQLVGESFTFSCALCEMTLRKDIAVAVFPPMPAINDSANTFDVAIQLDNNKSTKEIKKSFARKFSVDESYILTSYSEPNRPEVLHLQVDLSNYVFDDGVMEQFASFNGDVVVLEGGVKVIGIQVVDQCPMVEETSTDIWPVTGADCVATVETDNIVSARECRWEEHKSVWSNTTRWLHDPCYRHNDKPDLKQMAIDKQNAMSQQIFQGFMDLGTLGALGDARPNSSSLKDFVTLCDRILLVSPLLPANMKPDFMIQFRNDTSQMLVVNGESEFAATSRIASFVANMIGPDPVIGYNLSTDPIDKNITMMPIRLLEQNYITNETEITVTVTGALIERFNHFSTCFTPEDSMYIKGTINQFSTTNPVINVCLSAFETPVVKGPLDQQSFVQIGFPPFTATSKYPRECAVMNTDIGDWDRNGCEMLKETLGSLTVCQCTINLDAFDNAVGEYIIYEPAATFQNYIKDHSLLYGIMVMEKIISLFGILSILATMIAFKKWRNDLGHQILLHMILALLLNLVFGFFNYYVHYDLKSRACLAIGVIRHYSYLAMFAWLFVMSGLQLKRLLTILGSKDTEHLIYKVALFAWVLPLVPIIVLTSLDTKFYRTDLRNRGFCYPEGLAFELTVQAPAAAVLIANVVIFVLITARIYNCFGWGVVEGMERNGVNSRKEQLRKLGTSLFIFFLFGLTWTFHFLSEEGVINNKFIFEYLFMITATAHVFMLSLFFIFLDKETRSMWEQAAADRIPWCADRLAEKKKKKQAKKSMKSTSSVVGRKFTKKSVKSVKARETTTV